MENFPNYMNYGQSPTVCVNHPDRVSYTQCGRCNRTVCGECQTAQGAGVVCPDCYRELNGGSSKAKGSFLARHWHITYTLILIVSLERMMGRWKFLFVYMAATLGAGLSVYIFDYYRGAVGASGGVYGLYGAFFVLLLLRKQKDTARLFILLMGIDVVQSLFHPNISHAGHFGGFVGGALATLLIIPFVKKPDPSEPPQQGLQRWFKGRF